MHSDGEQEQNDEHMRFTDAVLIIVGGPCKNSLLSSYEIRFLISYYLVKVSRHGRQPKILRSGAQVAL